MSSAALFKLGGAVLAGGALAYILLTIGGDIATGSGAQHFKSPLYAPVSTLQAVAGFAILLGLFAHYSRQHVEAGKLGLIGLIPLTGSIVLYAIALPLMGAVLFSWLVTQPATQHSLEGTNGPAGLMIFFSLSTLLNLVGIACYGIATWRARIFNRVTAGVLVAGGALAVVGFMVGSSDPGLPAWISDLPGQVFMAALAFLGLQLVAMENDSARQEHVVGRAAQPTT